MSIDKICAHYKCAVSQRKHEILAGYSKEHTQGYQDKGCYECKGLNKECKAYVYIGDLE